MRSVVRESIAAPCEVVFDLVHDYERRLEWDTLLSRADLEGGATRAARGVVATCVGRGWLAPFALSTVYVSFERGKVAAVKLVNRVPFFATWAASIRHAPTEDNEGSTITYTVHFTARPRWLRWIIEPIMGAFFRWETRKRLAALRAFLAKSRAS
ncbi:MAG: SRPBCC family protein [Myxococcales bacterium]|nr:SRPBCC family protein [Myxococcales bacterium]